MSMATQQPIESINPSDIGLGIFECEAALDALTDMEDEFKRNPDITHAQILAREVNNLKQERAEQNKLDLTDFINDWADINVPIYTDEVFKWYAQSTDRCGYADDAIKEFGHDDSIVQELQRGIFECLNEFAYAVLKDEEEAREAEEELKRKANNGMFG